MAQYRVCGKVIEFDSFGSLKLLNTDIDILDYCDYGQDYIEGDCTMDIMEDIVNCFEAIPGIACVGQPNCNLLLIHLDDGNLGALIYDIQFIECNIKPKYNPPPLEEEIPF